MRPFWHPTKMANKIGRYTQNYPLKKPFESVSNHG